VPSNYPAAFDPHRQLASLKGISRKQRCKDLDLYCLVLVLLAIGLWKILQIYHRPHYTAEKFRDKIIVQNLVSNFGRKTGRLYRRVAERCLFAVRKLAG
jgi:hypothetical protein